MGNEKYIQNKTPSINICDTFIAKYLFMMEQWFARRRNSKVRHARI